MKNKASAISLFGVSTLLLLFMLFDGLSMAQKTGEKAKKKLYISTIKANGVSTATANRVKEGIRLAVFEDFGGRYQVLDDDAIKVMYKQAEAIMASGCSDTSCITQIADGINADEIFYGEVLQEGGKIGISITSLERKGVSIRTKSIVKLSFFESQFDYAVSETARKLIDPQHKIDMTKAPVTQEIKLGGIEIKAVKGLDISVIQFKTSDDSIERIIAVLKKNVGEADTIYSKNNFIKARGRYEEILNDIKERLRPEQQEKVKDFSKGIIKRMNTTWVMQYKPDIEAVDVWIKEKKEPEESDTRKALKKYSSIEEDILKIPEVNKDAKNQLLGAINDRRDSIHIALLSMYEKIGDAAYRDYKFDFAMENYRTAEKELGYVIDSGKHAQNKERMLEKIKATIKTGRGYMENRVKSLVDQAEYLYFDRQETDAKVAMKNAYKLLTGSMTLFANILSIETYNKMALVMKINSLTAESESNLFAIIEEERRAIEEQKKAEEEKAGEQKKAEVAKARENKRLKYIAEMTKKYNWIIKDIGGIKFLKLPLGSFMMGSPKGYGDNDEHPQHKVTVNSFWMGMYEVTQKQYKDIMGDNSVYLKDDDLPIDNVSWYDAMEFCRRFAEKFKIKVRLPYEAEWEYGCRASTTTSYYWGNEINGNYCWYKGNSDYVTHHVGEKKPNIWGLFDMSGNVWEWCADWYSDDYYYNTKENNPTGPSIGKYRILRGGSWDDDSNDLRSGLRGGDKPDNRSINYGFRIVISEP